MTFKQLTDLAKKKKNTMIFISTKSCWWTHDIEDVKDATELFCNRQARKLESILKGEVDFSKRANLKRLIKQFEERKLPRVVDPMGNVLNQSTAAQFIQAAKKAAKSGFYGDQGLTQLMAAHHKNALGQVYYEFKNYPIRITPNVGNKGWHRIFGWCTITHPKNKKNQVLADSEWYSVEVMQPNKGWVTYSGDEDQPIQSVLLPAGELYVEKLDDHYQRLVENTIRRYKMIEGKLVIEKELVDQNN